MVKQMFHQGMKSIQVKLTLIGFGIPVISLLIFTAIVFWQSGIYNGLVNTSADELADSDLSHLTADVYSLVHSQDQSIQQTVDHNLDVAEYVLEQNGGVRLADAQVEWNAIDQINSKSEKVQLPMLLVGNTWLGQNRDSKTETPIVDTITGMVGGTATLFQRMNEQGDLLRVATNVTRQDGQRAIGTYIPAVSEDGTQNPVVAAILSGKNYTGVAYVVDAWYVTAYSPLKSAQGQIIGALYVGVRQENVDSLRQAIQGITIGKTGYVTVIGGKGTQQGKYIISHNGELDGESLWDTQDTAGNYVMRGVIQKALALQPGETAEVTYSWQDQGESQPREKEAWVAYYAPWDWVILATAYEDELTAYQSRLKAGQLQMYLAMVIAGAIISLAGFFFSRRIARRLALQLDQMAVTANQLAEDDLTSLAQGLSQVASGDLNYSLTLKAQPVNILTRDEIGDMAREFNLMIERTHEIGRSFNKMVGDLRNLIAEIANTACTLDATSTRLSSEAEQSGTTTRQISQTMQQMAERAAQQSDSANRTAATVDQMVHSIEGVAQGAEEQTTAVTQAAALTQQINTAIETVASNARISAENASRAATTAKEGASQVAETVQAIQTAKVQAALTAEKVGDMDRRSAEISTIIETIDEIARQTNLLSLNAAIEAARAGGEQGKAFGVVAAEVGALAERSSSAAKEVTQLIQGIQAAAHEVYKAMEINQAQVEQGAASAALSGTALDNIREVLSAVDTQATEIAAAAQQVRASAENLVDVMSSVSAVVEENTASTEEMLSGSGEMSQMAEEIADISQQNAAAIEQVTASAGEMNTQVGQVAASAQQLEDLSRELQGLVGEFSLGAEKTAGVAGELDGARAVQERSRS